MKTSRQITKIYCFVDETGQDTGGKTFYVVVVIVRGKEIGALRIALEEAETESGKKKLKWGSSTLASRENYLSAAKKAIRNKGFIYFAQFGETKEFIALTAFTLAQAIISYSGQQETLSTIIIDGLKEKEQKKILALIKNFHIRYRKLRGATDQSEPALRLADSIAGLVRDSGEEQKYAQQILDSLTRDGVVVEIQK